MTRSGKIATLLIVAGMASGAVERVFYGNRLDENNVLQESFFLPLSIFLLFGGVFLLIFMCARFIARKLVKPKG
jgi:hypothetical protein